MHFVDFLLHLLAFILEILRTFYGFMIEYVLPVASHVLPVLSRCIIQLTAEFLRVFFTYIVPALASLLRAFLWALTNALNALGSILLTLMDLELVYVNSQATIVCVIFAAIVYFRATESIFRFGNECVHMAALNVRFLWRLLLFCWKSVTYLYSKIFTRNVEKKAAQNGTNANGSVLAKKKSKKNHFSYSNGQK